MLSPWDREKHDEICISSPRIMCEMKGHSFSIFHGVEDLLKG